MELKDILYDKRDHIATITMNRPERLNSLGGSMSQSLDTAFKDADTDADIRVIVLTGAGRGFCAGLDMKDNAAGPGGGRKIPAYRGSNLARIILNTNKPTIAAVNGAAVGWGFELALLCDFRIAAEEARLGDIHVKRGLVQDNGLNFTLPRLIGWSRACEVLLTGDLFSAKDCERMGIVNKVVPGEGLKAATDELAYKLAANAPLAVQMSKRIARAGARMELDDALDYSMLTMWSLFATDDVKEGFKAFGEKREPRFSGQ
ncbi:MAG: enoyl-CoA hydratase/isomerase family protein [Dehalococcoidia bacterium]|nr:enoyl-CoA hydratase/isomerase family protein [Dehalococcoidia bacterium]